MKGYLEKFIQSTAAAPLADRLEAGVGGEVEGGGSLSPKAAKQPSVKDNAWDEWRDCFVLQPFCTEWYHGLFKTIGFK